MNTSLTLGTAAALLTVLVGCSKTTSTRDSAHAQESVAPGMTPASRGRSAAEQIASARCEREQACGNIGDDETYTSRSDCFARIQSDWKDDLSARACPGGINQRELDECLGEVRQEACENPFDTLSRIAECTQGQICIEQP